jgi:hypothetical protein
MKKEKQESSFSEEKAAKRLLFIWAAGAPTSRLPISQSFLRSFFLKKRPLTSADSASLHPPYGEVP